MLRPLDIVILLKIHCKKEQPWSQMSLAKELHISSRSVNEGLKRAAESRLYDPINKKVWPRAMEDLLIHGVKHFIPPHQGAMAKGVPTAWAALPLSAQIISSGSFTPVWPSDEGDVLGVSFEPLHPAVPRAASEDSQLYELLALVDAVRGGRARERNIASEEISRRLAA